MITRCLLVSLSILALHSSCNVRGPRVFESTEIKTGRWRGTLEIQGKTLPFNLQLFMDESRLKGALINGEDTLALDEITLDGDSIEIPLNIYDASIRAAVRGDSLKGHWSKNYLDNYIVPFLAFYDQQYRFDPVSAPPSADVNGKWEVDFIEDDTVQKAIGLFQQIGHELTGTFLTPTGDYRFLAGQVTGDSMFLSTFDGVFAYLFEAAVMKDGTIDGQFWSGMTRHQFWRAKRNPEFELPDPKTLTNLKDEHRPFWFQFPDDQGQMIDLDQKKFANKVVVVQILGSWCPNCMDETRFLAAWYDQNAARGVEIIGLAFEKKDDFNYASDRVRRMRSIMDVPYPILIAGSSTAGSVEKALPMIDRLWSYPTTIFLDKNHVVRKIHTGFSGPGTGVYYDEFIEEFNLFVNKLLEE